MPPATRSREIGQGAFGKVYQGKFNGEDVAVKVINIDNMRDAEREITVLRSLNHRNIVKYKGGLNRGSSLEIYMEFCDGGDLHGEMSNYSRTGRQIPEATLKGWLRQTVTAIQYIHGQSIIHRDIKPSNIMLHQGVVKIGDFGLAKIFASKLDFINASVLGTPCYACPEILLESYCDEKGDVWSIGATFYHLANFKPPFDRPQNIRNYVNGSHKLDQVRGGYSDSLKKLITDLLHPEKNKRSTTGRILQVLGN